MTGTFVAIADAHALAASPTYKNPQSPVLGVDSSPFVFSYIDVGQPVPVGSSWTVVSAMFYVFQKGAATGGSRILTARPITAGWQESTLDWNHKPAAGATGYASAAQGDSATDGRVWAMDVTAAMQAVADGAPFYGFRVESNNSTIMTLHSSESPIAAFHPKLVIVVAPNPEPPAYLNPSAGRAVSVIRPTVNFDYVDPDGDAMQAFQLQANPTNDFTAPALDTGTVPSTVKEWTWNVDITVGSTRWWRVRVQDVAGNWSDWSQPTSFIRTAKPTVAWVTPASTTFTDPNLPHDVSLSGGPTQTARQSFLADSAGNVVAQLPKFASTVTAAAFNTIGASGAPGSVFIPTPGQTYTLTRRTWDNVARATTPGDPAYVDIQKSITFATSGASPISAFTAGAEVAGLPGIGLDWTDTTATADQYLITRDGVAVALVDFADTLVSGTSHNWVDEVPISASGHDYKIYAVTAGVTSNASATAHGANLPEGVWVRIPKTQIAVQLVGNLSVDPNELSTVYSPLGAENQVVLKQARYGRKGTLQDGSIGDGSDSLAVLEAAEAKWEQIRNWVDQGNFVVLVQINKSMVAELLNTWTGYVDEAIAMNGGSFIPMGFDYIERV